jgi:hypothetical protein
LKKPLLFIKKPLRAFDKPRLTKFCHVELDETDRILI